jgi:hydroxyacylglutathione hydrolase
MILKRYFIEGLAHASYLVGAGGEAAVVDPKRDVDDYIADAESGGMRIVAILNSHPHADFASGFPELARRTGARIYTSHRAPVQYERVAAKDGDRIRIGNLEIEMWETPGHSPDSLSFLVRENEAPTVIFTGDLLFVGDVGRPDLRDADADPRGLAEKLYDSLHRVLKLPDDVKIYPAHGAGSLCGRALGSAPFSLVGQERVTNWAALIRDRAEFVREMVSNLPDRPPYFSYDVGVNLRGAVPLSELPELRAMTGLEVEEAASGGAIVLDTRSSPIFGAGHVPGSLNIGLASAMFSTWVGFMIPGDSSIVLVVDSPKDAAKARLELARIGFDRVSGYMEAGHLEKLQQISQISISDLKRDLLDHSAPYILDVRTPGEWKKEHIEGAHHIPLPELPRRLEEVPNSRPVATVCRSGYRSSIAASLLQKNGVPQVKNIMGGMAAYMEVAAPCPSWHPADLVFPGEGI